MNGERLAGGNSGFEALLQAVWERRAAGNKTIGRLFGTARFALTAAWACESPRPVVLLTARDADLLPAASDLEVLLTALDRPCPVFRLPGPAVNPYAGVAPHAEVLALRAQALAALANGEPAIVVASAAGALCRTAAPERMASAGFRVALGGSDGGQEPSPAAVAERLAAAGYRYEDPVSAPGDFARRGGIVDLFPVDRELPLRIEFGFDGVEDIREFEVETQRSGEHLGRETEVFVPPAWEWIGASVGTETHPAFALPGTPGFASGLPDYLTSADVLVEEPERFREAAEAEIARIVEARVNARTIQAQSAAAPTALVIELESLLRRLEGPPPAGAVELSEVAAPDRSDGDLPARPADSFHNRIAEFLGTLTRAGSPRRVIHVFVPGAAAAERFRARAREAGARVPEPSSGVATESPIPETGDAARPPRVFVHSGRLSSGFEMPGLDLEVISAALMVAAPPRPPSRRSRTRSFRSDFRDLNPGDPVVHTDHGVGRFVRMARIGDGEGAPELVEIHYAAGAKLFLPVERLDLLEKYAGGTTGAPPPLDQLGGTRWLRRRQRVAKATRDIAGELIRLYAERSRIRGFAFSRETPGLDEFEDRFEWTETPDQAQAIRDVFADMESDTPMDRLLAGDVGFGKTEVGLRASFKATMDGKQVAVLVPTTVLAAQHARVFAERFEPFPVQVAMLSRFQTKKRQNEIVAGLQDGTVDIVIGTHRMLSKDVGFRDLGLLVVDEEQRFGVSAKERLRQLTTRVDHLAMTATPIPRTLNMSLSGIRDMSVIETAPRDRMAIQTHVLPFDGDRIAEAVRYELAREGQVYFVHNRVRSLDAMEKLLSRLVPEARILTAHGQLREKRLEATLIAFQAHEADILLSTTIIENGLDLPRVNTLIVNRADAFGLAQLYQIRGRVGRSSRRAYAYFLTPRGAPLSDSARPRLAALREFSELGAGFRVAALDMELRGAGNLLGAAQHGHMEAVGFDLFYRLLEEAVSEARGEAPRSRCTMNLRFQIRVPESYLNEVRRRMWLYKRCSAITEIDALDRLADEVRDRFGPPPPEVEMLFEHVRLRVRAERLGYGAVNREGDSLRFEGVENDLQERSFRTPLPPGAGPNELLASLAAALTAVEAATGAREQEHAGMGAA